MTAIRVMLVDDHAVVRDGLRLVLESQPAIRVVAEAASGEEAVRLADLHRPDVILMDVNMPKGWGGAQTTRIIKERFSDIKVLALSMLDDEDSAYAMLGNGADGYVVKHAPASDVIEAIRAVHNGETALSPSIAKQLVLRTRSSQNAAPGPASLSQREGNILDMLARGLTSKEIARDLCLSVKTVNNYRARILQKLEAHNTTEAIANALKQRLLPTSA